MLRTGSGLFISEFRYCVHVINVHGETTSTENCIISEDKSAGNLPSYETQTA